MIPRTCLSGLAAGCVLLVALVARPDGEKANVPRFRRPVALVPIDDGRRLLVANRAAGSVSLVDTERGRVIAEATIGRTLAGLADAGGGRFLAVDEAAGELLLLARDGDTLAVRRRLRVGDAPVSVCVLPGGRAAVACLWSRSLVLVELPADGPPRVVTHLDLPFAPRLQLALPGGDRVLVADAFGGRLAVVNVRRGAVESLRSLPGHNIRGLALGAGGGQLLLAHQVLAEDTPTRADDVRWGNVVSNVVRVVAVADVLRPDADLLARGRLHHLGAFRKGAADPAGLAVIGGEVIVALGGTGEVAFGPPAAGNWPRLTVGRRPTAVAVRGQRAFVADTFGDSVVIVDVKEPKKLSAISLGPSPEPGPAERGEVLFYDGRLSMEGWMSCHSCHSDGHTNGLRSDTLGDGSYGAPKRVPTLRGVGDSAPWTWNGGVSRLEEQVLQSLRTTMHGPRPTERQAADLTAYLRSLPPPPGLPAPAESVRRGEAVFRDVGCVRCHAPPTYTTPRTYDVGLEDEEGRKLFNPPSLRGVGHGTAFLHDGRAATLEEVFTRHRHQIPADLARKDLDDLLAFLRSL